jgi:hypothetical protein
VSDSDEPRIKTTGGRRRIKKTIDGVGTATPPDAHDELNTTGNSTNGLAEQLANYASKRLSPRASVASPAASSSAAAAAAAAASAAAAQGSASGAGSGGGGGTATHRRTGSNSHAHRTRERHVLHDDDDALDEPSLLETSYRGHTSSSSKAGKQHAHKTASYPAKTGVAAAAAAAAAATAASSSSGALGDDMDMLSESEVAFLRNAAKKKASFTVAAPGSSKEQLAADSSEQTSLHTTLRLNDVVVLDVGGSRFTTTLSTLTKYRDTFFGALFGGQYQVPRQADGSVFIDRDGTHFRSILNFLRCGTMVWPAGARARREVLLEASFYGLDTVMLQASQPGASAGSAEGEWRSNVIFIGILNIDRRGDDRVVRALADVQAPSTSEMVWQSIHDPGLTVIFQIINDENSDFSLAGISRVLTLLESWRRPLLRFVLVYDAELIRELLKLSGEPFNNSSYIWYFSTGKLIDCGIALKLRYVSENIWRHHAFVSSRMSAAVRQSNAH